MRPHIGVLKGLALLITFRSCLVGWIVGLFLEQPCFVDGSGAASVYCPTYGVIMWIVFITCPNSAIQIPKSLSSLDQ